MTATRPSSRGTKQDWIDYAEELGADLTRAVVDLGAGSAALDRAAAALTTSEARSSELEERIAALELVATSEATPARQEWISLRTEGAERYQRIRTLSDQLEIAREKLRALGVV